VFTSGTHEPALINSSHSTFPSVILVVRPQHRLFAGSVNNDASAKRGPERTDVAVRHSTTTIELSGSSDVESSVLACVVAGARGAAAIGRCDGTSAVKLFT
jgi:hypothetical protein